MDILFRNSPWPNLSTSTLSFNQTLCHWILRPMTRLSRTDARLPFGAVMRRQSPVYTRTSSLEKGACRGQKCFERPKPRGCNDAQARLPHCVLLSWVQVHLWETPPCEN